MTILITLIPLKLLIMALLTNDFTLNCHLCLQLTVANTQAHYSTELITNVKSIIVHAPDNFLAYRHFQNLMRLDF
jgi:hypothetical protein